jgi:predicted class III extradiol MEMO1 family dioxygenase
VISPHAGLRYSGAIAAVAYSCLAGGTCSRATAAEGIAPPATAASTTSLKRVVLFGPSHKAYIDGCAVSGAHTYETPVGDLRVDTKLAKQLLGTGAFRVLTQEEDEDEHSLEMQLPLLVRALARCCDPADVTIVPILVGRLSHGKEKEYASLLSPILVDPGTFIVVSSDFCHWGDRFDFMTYDKEAVRRMGPTGTIADGIEAMDRRGMEVRTMFHLKILFTLKPFSIIVPCVVQLIEARNLKGFQAYLKETKNTICGRNPIELLLASLDTLEGSVKSTVTFVAYGQSSRVSHPDDSSVSYAAAIVRI